MHLEEKNTFQCLFKLSVVIFDLFKAFLQYKRVTAAFLNVFVLLRIKYLIKLFGV